MVAPTGTTNTRSVTTENFFPYANKYARSVMDLVTLYVSIIFSYYLYKDKNIQKSFLKPFRFVWF